MAILLLIAGTAQAEIIPVDSGDPGDASVYIDTDGSIIISFEGTLYVDGVNFYKVFIGDNAHEETFDDIDVLHFDTGQTQPNWILGFTSKQNKVEGHTDENFGEFITSNIIAATGFDTGVNCGALPPGYKLWLKSGRTGEDPVYTDLGAPIIPEPGTLVLLASALIGLVFKCVRRRGR